MKYNLEGCFRNLKGIKMIIIANLSKEEREKFKKKEEALSSVLSGITMAKTGFDLSKQIEFTKKNGKEITQNLEDYSEAIMDTLKKYGYLIPAKETKTNLNN